MKFNRVTLNLPAHAGADLPNPGKPIVTIDGVEVENVKSVELQAGVEEITTVCIVFNAEVDGVMDLMNITNGPFIEVPPDVD